MKLILLILLGIVVCAVGYYIGNKCWASMFINLNVKKDGVIEVTCKMLLGVIFLGFCLLTIFGIFIPE